MKRSLTFLYWSTWLICCGGDGSSDGLGTRSSFQVGGGTYVEFGPTPAHCDRAPEACGGDTAGSWTLIQACTDDRKLLYTDDDCLSLDSHRTRATGAIYIRPDGTVVSALSGNSFQVLDVAPACIPSTCETVTFGASIAQCGSTAGACKCEFKRVIDLEYYVQDLLPQQLRAGQYCVSGDKLTLEDADLADGTAVTFERVQMPTIAPGEVTLMAAEVSFSSHCCTWPPNASNSSSRVVTAQVTPKTEFLGAHEYPLGPEQSSTIPHSVDVGATDVTFTYLDDSALAKGDFNGWRLAFAGAHFARIVDARVTSDSHAPSLSPRVSFDDRILYVSSDGGEVLAGDWFTVELMLQ